MKTFSGLTGHFLIATPSMVDPNFFQTVIYICEHNEKGALGIVINRPTTVKLAEILDQMKIHSDNIIINEMPVLYGGPVHQERGFVIHRPIGKWRSSFMPSTHVVITTSRDILEALAGDNGPDDAIITLGYTGWGAGQLEEEVIQSTWLNCQAKEEVIFNTPYEKRWGAAAALLGITDIYNLSIDSGHG